MARIDVNTHGVTRWPIHPRFKKIFANNFKSLAFKLNGKQIPNHLVRCAYPAQGQLVVFKTDANGNIPHNNNNPEVENLTGEVEVIGNANSCGCSSNKFRVQKWWENN